MYAEDGEDLKLAEELFKDIEAYRTDKMNKDDFLAKWETEFDDNDVSSLELNFNKKESGEKIKIHMNAILG